MSDLDYAKARKIIDICDGCDCNLCVEQVAAALSTLKPEGEQISVHPDQTSPMTVGPEAFLEENDGWQREAEAHASALSERAGINIDDYHEFMADLEGTLIEFAEGSQS